MLNWQTMGRCHRFDRPFTFGLIEDPFIDLNDALSLCREFPADGFEYCRHDRGRFLRRPLFLRGDDRPCQADRLGAKTLALAEQLASRPYREWLADVMSVDLAGAEIEAWFWRYDFATDFVPHRDHETKLITHVLYLNESWPATSGGQLRILGSEAPDDVVLEITPSLHLSTLIKRSEQSWHLITPIHRDAAASRNSLTIHFHRR